MKKEFSKFFVASLKRTAQNVSPLVRRKQKLQAEIAEREEELKSIQVQLDTYEAPIKEATGVDPHNPADVQKMMNRYFLLAFGIYDTENKLLDVMYDGESQFSTESIRELAAKNKKDTNLLAMNKY